MRAVVAHLLEARAAHDEEAPLLEDHKAASVLLRQVLVGEEGGQEAAELALDLADLVDQDHVVEEVEVDPHAFEGQPVDAVGDGLPLLLLLLLLRFFLVIRPVGPLVLLPHGLRLLLGLWSLHFLRLSVMIVILFYLKDHLLVLDPAHLLYEGYGLLAAARSLLGLLLSLVEHL